MRQSEKIDQLSAALVKAQAAVEAPVLDGTNPHFKNRYATLKSVRQAVLPAFHANDLAVLQAPGAGEKGPTLTTTIVHKSGQFLELGPLCLPVQRQDAQSYGSGITYMRRYSLLALAGAVAEEDDDGEAAVAPARKEQASRPSPLPRAEAEAEGRKRITPEQRAQIEQLVDALQISADEYDAALADRKVAYVSDLSRAQ